MSFIVLVWLNNAIMVLKINIELYQRSYSPAGANMGKTNRVQVSCSGIER